jgi:hypothetical protein
MFESISAPSGAPVSYPPTAPAGPGWLDSVQELGSDQALVLAERLGLALLIFIGGWLVARCVSWLVHRALCATEVGQRAGRGAAYVDAFLAYLLRHVLVAMLIVGVGLGLGGLVRDLLAARAAPGEARPVSARWLGEFARHTVLVFAFTLAVHQLGVAQDFVLMSFGLLFGALCLAAALAFGLGARNVTGDIVRRRHQQLEPGAPAAPMSRQQSGPRRGGMFRPPANP